MDEPKLLPEWRQAVKDYLAAGFKPGDVISRSWFERHFDMPELDSDQPLTVSEFQDRQFKWLQNIEAFRAELLEEHQICLANVHGTGYRVVPPGEQTGLAQDKFESEARKAYKRAAKTLRHVRMSELTDDQRKENMDAVAKLSMLRGMHKGLSE